MILALLQRELNLVLTRDPAVRGGDRRPLILQEHAAEQLLHERLFRRMLQHRAVDLRHVVLRMDQIVLKRAVVRQNKEPGGVFIQPSDRLNIPVAERCGEQRENARMEGRLHRALVALRLIHRDNRLLKKRPGLALHHEALPFRLHRLIRILNHGAVPGNVA